MSYSTRLPPARRTRTVGVRCSTARSPPPSSASSTPTPPASPGSIPTNRLSMGRLRLRRDQPLQHRLPHPGAEVGMVAEDLAEVLVADVQLLPAGRELVPAPRELHPLHLLVREPA